MRHAKAPRRRGHLISVCKVKSPVLSVITNQFYINSKIKPPLFSFTTKLEELIKHGKSADACQITTSRRQRQSRELCPGGNKNPRGIQKHSEAINVRRCCRQDGSASASVFRRPSAEVVTRTRHSSLHRRDLASHNAGSGFLWGVALGSCGL